MTIKVYLIYSPNRVKPKITLPTDKRYIILPKELTKIHSNGKRIPIDIFDNCLGAVFHEYSNKLCRQMLPDFLLKTIYKGPIARCGGAFCPVLLFTTCFLLLVKR